MGRSVGIDSCSGCELPQSLSVTEFELPQSPSATTRACMTAQSASRLNHVSYDRPIKGGTHLTQGTHPPDNSSGHGCCGRTSCVGCAHQRGCCGCCGAMFLQDGCGSTQVATHHLQ